MKVVLFDPSSRHWLYPFTLTRSVADLRKGLGTIRETWEVLAAVKPAVTTVPYLSETNCNTPDDLTLFINAILLPSQGVWDALQELRPGEGFFASTEEYGPADASRSHSSDAGGSLSYLEPAGLSSLGQWTPVTLVAFCTKQPAPFITYLSAGDVPPIGAPNGADLDIANLISSGFTFRLKSLPIKAKILSYPWQLIQWNDDLFRADFALFTAGRISAPIPAGNQVVGAEDIFIEEGARISCSILNASTGPIYIGRNAEIMEGCLIRGPLAMGEGATLKMGTKIYGAATIGPYCTVGGELKNVILTGYSNKGHDGYLGDALLGEWCNLGAGTSNSNVRNNATSVRVWNPGKGAPETAGLKAGLLMGDYSRSAIQTAFNTGAVVGVCCNIFGAGLCSGYVPDFSWGSGRYEWEKVVRDIGNWKKLKGQTLTEKEIQVLRHIFGPK